MLRKWLGFVGVSGLLVTAPLSVVNAADLVMRKAPPRPPVLAWSWTGFYAGINGGYGWNVLSGDPFCINPAGVVQGAGCALVPNGNLRPSGALFGGQAGYNFQSGSVVYGVEADIQGADIKDSSTTSPPGFLINGGAPPAEPFGPGTFSESQRLDWFGTARVRVGWAPVDRALLYVTGGLIYGQESVSESLAFTGGPTYGASGSSVRTGGTIGGGLEFALNRNLSGKVEALYFDMGSQTMSSGVNPATGFAHNAVFNYKGGIIRGGLNWNFGDPSGAGEVLAPVSTAGMLVKASAPARAKGMLVKASPPPAADDWSGFYLGGNVGAAWGTSDVVPQLGVPFPVFTNTAGNLITPAQFGFWPPASGNDASIIGGGQAGYNWQAGPWVYGLEGDVDGTGLREKSTSTLSRTTISGTQTVTANFSANVDWIASLRARAGYVWDRTMLYATVGVAVAGTSLGTTYAVVEPTQPAGFAPSPGASSGSATVAGWTAGVGGAWAIDRAWSVGVEYRHTDLSRSGYNLGLTDVSLAPFVAPTPGTVHFTTDQVTSRVNWHPWN